MDHLRDALGAYIHREAHNGAFPPSYHPGACLDPLLAATMPATQSFPVHGLSTEIKQESNNDYLRPRSPYSQQQDKVEQFAYTRYDDSVLPPLFPASEDYVYPRDQYELSSCWPSYEPATDSMYQSNAILDHLDGGKRFDRTMSKTDNTLLLDQKVNIAQTIRANKPPPVIVEDAMEHSVRNEVLYYRDLEAARAITIDRIPLELNGPDDVDMVKQEAATYVIRMLATFQEDGDQYPPKSVDLDPVAIAYFPQWQIKQHNAVEKKLNIDLANDPAYVEKRCWLVLQAVIDTHELGAVPIGNTHNTLKPDLTIKCSERMLQIISTVRAYHIARLDVVKYTHIDQLVANPAAYRKRKISNMSINSGKQKKYKVDDDVHDEASRSTKTRKPSKQSLQTSAKLKKRSRSDDADNDDERSQPQEVPAKKRVKVLRK